MTTLKFYRLMPHVQIPEMATIGSACFDMRFQYHGLDPIIAYDDTNIMQRIAVPISAKSITIPPHWRVLLPTGLILDIPEGHSVRVHPRSGLSIKKGLTLINCEGVIDSDYVEEVMITAFNASHASVTIDLGERLAQGELIKNLDYVIAATTERPQRKSNRAGGFGSTGSK